MIGTSDVGSGDVGGGPGLDLAAGFEGVASGSASATAALEVGRPLSGQAAGSSASSSAMLAERTLSGQAAGSSASSSSAAVTRTLIASSAGLATASLAEAVAIGGRADSAATVVSSLILRILVPLGDGASAGQAAVVGTLSTRESLQLDLVATPATPKAGERVVFDVRGSVNLAAYPTATFTWNFDNGQPLVTTGMPVMAVTFPAPGTYNVTVTVKEGTVTVASLTEAFELGEPVAVITQAPALSLPPTISARAPAALVGAGMGRRRASFQSRW